MNSWIPYPVAVVWTAAFVLVALVHLAHVAVMAGRHRLWHVGHVVMAVGMLVMFWPAEPLLGIPATAGVWAYAIAACAVALALVVARWRGVRLGPLWLASVADFAAMAYMFALMSGGLAWLSVLATVWFAAQTLGWVSGWLNAVLEHGGLGEPVPAARRGVEPLLGSAPFNGPDSTLSGGPTRSPDSGSTGGVAMPSRVAARPGGPFGNRMRDWSVRATLAVMAAGMGYMMLAMQFGGMAAMSDMANM